MTKIVVVAALFIHPGHEAEFEEFEVAAARIMMRHGGAVERRIGLAPDHDPKMPHEVHIVVFPDRKSYQGYRDDPDLRALSGLRARAIRDTTVWVGEEREPFKS